MPNNYDFCRPEDFDRRLSRVEDELSHGHVNELEYYERRRMYEYELRMQEYQMLERARCRMEMYSIRTSCGFPILEAQHECHCGVGFGTVAATALFTAASVTGLNLIILHLLNVI